MNYSFVYSEEARVLLSSILIRCTCDISKGVGEEKKKTYLDTLGAYISNRYEQNECNSSHQLNNFVKVGLLRLYVGNMKYKTDCD